MDNAKEDFNFQERLIEYHAPIAVLSVIFLIGVGLGMEEIQDSLVLEELFYETDSMTRKAILQFIQFYGSNIVGILAAGALLPTMENYFVSYKMFKERGSLVLTNLLNTVILLFGAYWAEFYSDTFFTINEGDYVKDINDVIYPAIAGIVLSTIFSVIFHKSNSMLEKELSTSQENTSS